MKKLKGIPDDHLKVLNAIVNADGKYITRDQILLQIGQPVSYTRELVSIVRSLVVNYDYPIGASSKGDTRGYFIIEDEDDRTLAIRTLESRIVGTKKRIEALRDMEIKRGSD